MEFTKTTITLAGLLMSSIIANFTGFASLDELYETGAIFNQNATFSGICEQYAGKIQRHSASTMRYYQLLNQPFNQNSPKKDQFGFAYANLCDSCSEVSIRKYYFKDKSISQAYETIVSSYRLPLRLNLPGKSSQDSFDIYNDIEAENGRNCYIYNDGLVWVQSSDIYNVPLLIFKKIDNGVEMLYYKRLDV